MMSNLTKRSSPVLVNNRASSMRSVKEKMLKGVCPPRMSRKWQRCRSAAWCILRQVSHDDKLRRTLACACSVCRPRPDSSYELSNSNINVIFQSDAMISKRVYINNVYNKTNTVVWSHQRRFSLSVSPKESRNLCRHLRFGFSFLSFFVFSFILVLFLFFEFFFKTISLFLIFLSCVLGHSGCAVLWHATSLQCPVDVCWTGEIPGNSQKVDQSTNVIEFWLPFLLFNNYLCPPKDLHFWMNTPSFSKPLIFRVWVFILICPVLWHRLSSTCCPPQWRRVIRSVFSWLERFQTSPVHVGFLQPSGPWHEFKVKSVFHLSAFKTIWATATSFLTYLSIIFSLRLSKKKERWTYQWKP